MFVRELRGAFRLKILKIKKMEIFLSQQGNPLGCLVAKFYHEIRYSFDFMAIAIA